MSEQKYGPVRQLTEELMHKAFIDEGLRRQADLLDKLFAEQSARIAKIEADHAAWAPQVEKVLADLRLVMDAELKRIGK